MKNKLTNIERIQHGEDGIILELTHEEYVFIEGLIVNRYQDDIILGFKDTQKFEENLLRKFLCDDSDFKFFKKIANKIKKEFKNEK